MGALCSTNRNLELDRTRSLIQLRVFSHKCSKLVILSLTIFRLSLQVQTESESSSPDEVGRNSATEISTDSEFDQDPLAKSSQNEYYPRRPQRVNVRQGLIENNVIKSRVLAGTQLTEKEQNRLNRNNYELGLELNIQPLVQVDPTVLNSNRTPLKNPRPGDYLLNKVASTEGIASKKSLELKKRYLLGEPTGTGLMKSGSTSVLESKFKNFHSNISECQKLLNVKVSPEKKEEEEDEKKSVYGQINFQKGADVEKSVPISETINTKLVENKLKEISNKISSPLSSEKKIIDEPIVFSKSLLSDEMIKSNKEFIDNLSTDADVIDLTVDDSDEKGSKEKIVYDHVKTEQISEEVIIENGQTGANKTKSTIEPSKLTASLEDEMININKPSSDVESDSLSSASSSSSSLNDIPHFILDSTTSPDTQNLKLIENDRFAPRLEIRNTGGELMQIDSLMIVDGKYVGDPEDLKLLEKLPEGTIVEQFDDIKLAKDRKLKSPRKDVNFNLDYQSKPTLRFDTRNENKIETLKNLPMSNSKSSESGMAVLKKLSPDENGGASDSETDLTGQVFTETELSDWADDAVSENFVDLEFVLNSNKGTIRRNKKGKKKDSNAEPKTTVGPEPQAQEKEVNVEKKVETCNIMKNLGIENLEFMDTGSDDSCAETYSTTNKAMLKNRGYVEFVEPSAENAGLFRNSSTSSIKQNQINYEPAKEEPVKEIPGIDFVEQGACILNSDYNDLKTPVNEMPRTPFANMSLKFSGMHNSGESLNDIEQDSLIIVDNFKEIPANKRDNDMTPQNNKSFNDTIKKSTEHLHDKSRKRSMERLVDGEPNKGDDMSYEEYVRQLQITISQISNARDSIDLRKGKRKSSKGDLTAIQTEFSPDLKNGCQKPFSIFDDKITQPPTLTKKLEELTKERAKQKDLIHDLVMDKLQSKKQLNAEKRLNRSRNRQLGSLSPGMSSSSPLSNQIKIPQISPKEITTIETMDPGLEIRRHSLFDNPPLDKVLGITSASPEKGVNKENYPLNEDLLKTPPKITKTQSFCVYSSRFKPTITAFNDDGCLFSTPKSQAIPRADPETEKLRQEARAKARLKTNEDLGISPEEKILQLRRRYQLEKQQQSPFLEMGSNKSDDLKVKEKFMMASKSVNDIRNEKLILDSSLDGSGAKGSTVIERETNGSIRKKSGEFQSDSNLIEAAKSTDSKRRGGKNKDPERRKSLIQAVSDFFHKKKELTSSPSTSSSQLPKEKTDTIFNRFKISPNKAAKEKAKVRLN